MDCIGASYTPTIAESALFARDPHARFVASRDAGRRDRKALAKRMAGWPQMSPGAANAWLLLVTTKPPSWRDRLLEWPGGPPTVGTPHEGFFYPDPLGFWTEVRRWTTDLFRTIDPGWATTDALSITALLHADQDAQRIAWAIERCEPVVTLYLDEAARSTSGIEPSGQMFSIPDPHRPGTVYEGWWASTDDGRVVGKSPQHPASHLLYDPADMDEFLRAVPIAHLH
ncbi:MAG: hypothetical protein ACYDH6_03360 [Acidimicrobiales bacterium]